MDRPFWTGLAVGVLLAFKTWGCPNAAQAEAVLRAEGYAEVRPAARGNTASRASDAAADAEACAHIVRAAWSTETGRRWVRNLARE